MITITAGKAVFSVRPENAEKARAALALFAKGKGKKYLGKQSKDARAFPVFVPGMSTQAYINKFFTLNAIYCNYHAAKQFDLSNAADSSPMLDPAIPECEQLPDEVEALPAWLS